MKSARNIYFFLALVLAAQANISFGMNIAITIAKAGISGICSLTELFVTATPILGTVLEPFQSRPIEKLSETQSIAPQIITDYVTQISKERGMKDTIKVIVDEECDSYGADRYETVIYINSDLARELVSLLENNNRQLAAETKLNNHTGSIHHELTHKLRNSGHRLALYRAITATAGAIITSSILSHVIKKNAPTIQNNFILNNAFKIARSGFTFLVAAQLMRSNKTFLDNLLYNHYEEMQADKGIPNKKELLEPQAAFYETRHTEYLEYIEHIKTNSAYSDIISPMKKYNCNQFELLAMKTIPINWFNNPYLMSATLYARDQHPSDIQRALHFRKRIEDIDRAAIIDQK
jgi:hypothetical protein